MRAASTVVDATLFLLLVGGAVATLVGATGAVGPEPDASADESARVLATTTARVNYTLSAPAPERAGAGLAASRSAHGTVASLLADAAVERTAVDGRPLAPASDDYAQRTARIARTRAASSERAAAVRAVWEPYPDAPVSGRVRVGDRPPRDVDVNAATVTVDSGLPPSRARARRAAATDGFDGLASVLARTVIRGLFPPERTTLALRGDHPTDALTALRYRRADRVLDAGPIDPREESVPAMNDRLATPLSDRFERDLRARYDDPERAAADVDTGSVTVTVRTWSP